MPADDPKRRELGDFLRARRGRLSPETVGLARHRRRRTPGLRREEVAELAGIGVDWYIRLEQGRPVTPSAGTVDALARALHLSEAEHQHLRALTGGGGPRAFRTEVAPPALLRLIESLTQPAYIVGRRRDLLAWNAEAAEVLGFDLLEPEERNILLAMLVHPHSRALFGVGWEAEARRMVEQFRATHDLWASDPAFVDLLARLRAGCPEFETWWEPHEVRAPTAGLKRLHHPRRGELVFEHTSFQASDDPNLKLVIYTPVTDAS
ncbi:MAG: helix-turn-helix domain-containing protein [Alphaproteobacteria bacterium]|jgi:transcriptional regulator with XRE-family HTH domain|nr:helix-turn-helix domain-containing protein [Alphaproteobacteria bacterium]